jgi:hypothetical protein
VKSAALIVTTTTAPACDQPLPPYLRRHLAEHAAADHTIVERAELFSVSRAAVYRVIERAGRSQSNAA